MKLASALLLVAFVASGCAGRQSDPARTHRAPRAAAAPSPAAPVAQAEPAEAAQPAAPASPASAETAPPPDGQKAVFAPSAADQVFVRRMLDLIDEIAVVMETHQNACDRMATDLELIMRRNQDLVGQAKAMKGNAARDTWMQEQAMPRLQKAMPKMMTGLQNCQNNTRLQALMRQLAS